MRAPGMNYKRAFGGKKKLPKAGNIRTIKGVRRGIRIGKRIARDF